MLGKLDRGWPYIENILQKAAVAKCAEMVGGAQQVLEMTVQYAKDRVQFDRPIGSFQAVQHFCANMAIDVDSCRFITYQAAWKISNGLPSDKDVAMTKAWVSDTFRKLTFTAHQIHGGVGYTEDHDLHLYTKRAKSWELAFGDADFYREVVAIKMGL